MGCSGTLVQVMLTTQGQTPADAVAILGELQRTLLSIAPEQMEDAKRAILAAPRVFTVGAGRSGLALRMAAMRLMHLGLTVHVAGEVTTPAIAKDDLLLVASGSGTTASALHAAEVANRCGASVLAITTDPSSPLARLAKVVLHIPAATKQAHGNTISQQYSGALFEQSVLLLMDTLFQQMWHQRGETAEELWKRHANLE